jgi:hypothetical protein
MTELGFQRDQLQKTNTHVFEEVISLKSNIDQLHQQINEQKKNSHLNETSQTTPSKSPIAQFHPGADHHHL